MVNQIYALIGKSIRRRKKKKQKEIKQKKYEVAANSYDEYGFNQHGFDREGYNRGGYDKYGFDRQGYNRDGYNRFGFNKEGYSYSGYDRDGYDREGYDRNGYNKQGLDRKGYDKQGYNISGESINSTVYFSVKLENNASLHSLNVGTFLRIKKEVDDIGEIKNITIFYGRYYLGEVPKNIFNQLIPEVHKYDITNFICTVCEVFLKDNALKIDIKIKRTILDEKDMDNVKKINESENDESVIVF